MHNKITLIALVSLFCWLATPQKAQAQDPRFSQFYAAPTELNPAMIGVYEGKFRLIANYRELYSSILASHPFRTIAASFDMRQRVQQQDYFGFGFSVLRDDAGISEFHRTKANVGASFMKQLGGSKYSPYDQYLIAGAQLGFGQHGLNWQRLWFSEQFDVGGGFVDDNAPSGENFDKRTTGLYLDFNAGLLWYILFEDHLSLYAGGALHHLNSPNVSFLEGSEDPLHTRWTGHAGGEIPFTRELSFLPAVAVMGQNTHFSTTFGGNFRYTNRDWKEVAIRAGGWVHFSNELESGVAMDAVVATAILEMERWNFGISYDITTSLLATANNSRGAFELSFIYTQPAHWRTSVKCPNFY
ncbi:MAG: PorP/SprF family type IX secretion system membrane protein [Phaeodactylibacter sp.]|nr:PorP/SprF family type IX secretion system membrane protein [Phaeodactylibacter sp.]MCB9289332.1 PorP/SprF family type IX secretion system membrane protein [Lewinellaceae bacterium]